MTSACKAAAVPLPSTYSTGAYKMKKTTIVLAALALMFGGYSATASASEHGMKSENASKSDRMEKHDNKMKSEDRKDKKDKKSKEKKGDKMSHDKGDHDKGHSSH